YRIENLNFTYPGESKAALSNINLTINSGEFITICGKTGCGKTTLLRHLKTILTPYGKGNGEIYFYGQPIKEVDQRTQVSRIGYVLQSPDNQIVTDKVWHELAFGLESLGHDSDTIRLRVAEMANFFGIQDWFYKNVTELSGGQKQLLNLASILAMQPSVLIFDEPTSQLDPVAAGDFLETVKKINRDLGITVIMTEHRLEEIIPISDRVIVMDEGKIIADDLPQKVGEVLNITEHPMFFAMTSAMQIHAGVKNDLPCPITVKDGRKWLDTFLGGEIPGRNRVIKREQCFTGNIIKSNNAAVRLKDIWFRYEKKSPDVIKDLSLKVAGGQFYCTVGGNGTGKTTILSLIGGIYKPYRGKILINGKNLAKMNIKERSENNLGMLPQNPETLFVEKTVELDLYGMLSDTKLTEEEKAGKIETVTEFVGIGGLLSRHPYDLSGGEQQKAALAKVLLMEPKILLLDEPTKGLDAYFKMELAGLIERLTAQGVTVIMASHDIEFCAKYADVCAMCFNGNIITANTARDFFAGNSFYTTAANRIARHICRDAVTTEDVIELCKQTGRQTTT
ncbi:MAG TPA: energy-coupling factor transporter ATPase, partial [Clostridia bacterium]|nr:energy-coupling factor transporter ATPase [Clostridia bacterium]